MTVFKGVLNVSGFRPVLVCSRFNDLVVDRLRHGAIEALVAHGVKESDVDVVWVPGALEIPSAVKVLAECGRYDAVVALGAVIRGETYHFEVVCNQSAAALSSLALSSGVVVTNGILTVDTQEQALDRAGGKAGNKGADVALAALEMVSVLNQVVSASAI